MNSPHLVLLSSLFPSSARPTAGVFIRERMFRVGRELPLTVVSPQAWFPGQSFIRLWRKDYRIAGADRETQQGVEIFRPRALCLPGVGRQWDGFAMALAAWPVVRRLHEAGRCDIIDAHFAYPDGYAASLLARWLGVPYTITLRGTETRHLTQHALNARIVPALRGAARVFAVSASLRDAAIAAGVAASQFTVVGNGVDTETFSPREKLACREGLAIAADAKVLVTVGGLVERKGFHRVIELLPALSKRFPTLLYLIIGGGSAEGDWSTRLRAQVERLGLGERVRFLGSLAPAALSVPLSAADVFVLPSSNEGWANVILEAMACGLPVVASDVGGNPEVIPQKSVGRIYPFGDAEALKAAIAEALDESWNTQTIIDYARGNSWDTRVAQLIESFVEIAARGRVLPAGHLAA